MMSARARGRWLLVVAMVAGAALVATGVVDRSPGAAGRVPDDAIAVVGGTPIARGDYRRALDSLAAVRRSGKLGRADRERVLQRLIDEELLVQRGLELGLASRDPSVRAAMSRAVIDMVVARAQLQQRDVTEATLRAFYRDNAARFRRPPRLHVREVTPGGSVVKLPAALLPATKLRDYVGGAVVARLTSARVGETVRVDGSSYLVVDRRDGQLPAFAAVRQQVLAAYQRRAADDLLRRTLSERRRRATITISRDRL